MDLGSPTDWHYLAEGGANLVLSYHGEHPELRGRVLRLRKRSNKSHDDATAASQHSLESRDPSVLLYEAVVTKLFPENAAGLREVVLPPGFLERGRELWSSARPTERASQDSLDVSRRTAVLAESMVQSDKDDSAVLAIEIKPKWGFMPNPQYLSAATRDSKSTYCRYCRHSQARRRATSYCPMDLFSQDPSRVKRALNALYEDWIASKGKTNNFRVFVDGHRISTSNEQAFANALERVSSPDATACLPPSSGGLLAAILTPLVISSPALRRVAQAQAVYDPIDIEGIAQLLEQRAGLKNLESYEADGSFLSALQLAGLGGEPTPDELEDLVDAFEHPLSASSDLRQLLVAYLLSAAFKDCSIFLSLQINAIREMTLRLKLVDVDLKSMRRLPHYMKLDQQLAQIQLASSS